LENDPLERNNLAADRDKHRELLEPRAQGKRPQQPSAYLRLHFGDGFGTHAPGFIESACRLRQPNYLPEGMTYTPADIAERNEYIDAFCAEVEPRARQAFQSAVARRTETESAEAIVDEARSALAELLAAPEHQPHLDEESRKLIEALASALKERPELRDRKTEDAWIERRSKDLARAVVGFWVNLGDDAPSRYKGSAVLLEEMIAGRDSERRRDFETIYSRFWLDSEEARQLLAYVEALGVVAPVVKRVQRKEGEDFAALFAKVVLVAEPMLSTLSWPK
jgi:hypothetical protein